MDELLGSTVWGPKVPTLKGTKASLSYVQRFLCLVSSSINVSPFLRTWLDTLWTDLIHEREMVIHFLKLLWAQSFYFSEHPWHQYCGDAFMNAALVNSIIFLPLVLSPCGNKAWGIGTNDNALKAAVAVGNKLSLVSNPGTSRLLSESIQLWQTK